MRKPLITSLALAVALPASLLVGTAPAGATTESSWVDLTPGQHIAFDPDFDYLHFATPTTADQVRLAEVGNDLSISVGAKAIFLDGVQLDELRQSTLTFDTNAMVLAGDGSSSTTRDSFGLQIDIAENRPNSQILSLGGADELTTTAGHDRLVGAPARVPLLHLSRTATTGSPTSTHNPSVSLDGTKAVFEGGWTEFGSTNDNGTDVIVRNVPAGTFSNEHKDTSGNNGGSGSGSAQISADGNYVVFASSSPLVNPGSPSNTIFRADTRSNAVAAVSTTTGGGSYANGFSYQPDVSADGRYVVFLSAATNLAAGSTGSTTDVFVKDLSTGTTTRVSTGQGGGDSNASAATPRISDDGQYVVFSSAATDLTATETGGGHSDVYVWSRASGALTNLSVGGAGVASSRNPDVGSHPDAAGGVVVFESDKALLPADTNGQTDVYARSVTGGTITLVSTTSAGGPVALSSTEPAVSGDGRFVAFRSFSDSLVPGDTNGYSDVFVKDRVSGAVALVSRTTAAQANQSSSAPDISADGRIIVFESSASNLSALDGNGGFSDVFLTGNPVQHATLIGKAGNDAYAVDAPAGDILVEAPGEGTDTVETSGTYVLTAPNVENLTLTGSAAVNGTGTSANNALTGNSASNTLVGNAGADSYTGGGGADTFSIDTSATVDVVTDFTVGTDKFRMRQSAWHIGDGDKTVEGATNRTGPGGFSRSAEYVVISRNLTSLTTANAAAAIGSATSSYATGNRRVFMVDNGTTSQLYLFISSGNDAKVTAGELKALMTFKNRNALSVSSLRLDT